MVVKLFYPRELKDIIAKLDAENNLRKEPLFWLNRIIGVYFSLFLFICLIIYLAGGFVYACVAFAVFNFVTYRLVKSHFKQMKAYIYGTKQKAVIKNLKVNEFLRTIPNMKMTCESLESGEQIVLPWVHINGIKAHDLKIGDVITVYYAPGHKMRPCIDTEGDKRYLCLRKDLVTQPPFVATLSASAGLMLPRFAYNTGRTQREEKMVVKLFYPRELKDIIAKLDAENNLRTEPLFWLNRIIFVYLCLFHLTSFVIFIADGFVYAGTAFVVFNFFIYLLLKSHFKQMKAYIYGTKQKAVIKKLKVNEFLRRVPNMKMTCELLESGEKIVIPWVRTNWIKAQGLKVGDEITVYYAPNYKMHPATDTEGDKQYLCLRKDLVT